VTTEEGEKKAKELNVMFIETSAKAGHNVKVGVHIRTHIHTHASLLCRARADRCTCLSRSQNLFRKIAQALPGVDPAATEQPATQCACTTRTRPSPIPIHPLDTECASPPPPGPVIDLKLNQPAGDAAPQAGACSC
jgi:hypothetical protein